MKTLKKDEKTGERFLEETEFHVDPIPEEKEIPSPEIDSKEQSPIVSKDNFPVQVKKAKLPVMNDIRPSLLSETQLLEEMRKAGGQNLTTTQFAILITPKVRRSQDLPGHWKWDLAHSYIRNLMRKLASQGLVTEQRDTSTTRVRYLYSLK